MFDSPPLPRLLPRQDNTHKGDYGHILLIGGCRGMSGAISIAAQSAMRAGSGLVTVATSDACVDQVAVSHPCLMTLPLASDSEGRIDSEGLERLRKYPRTLSAWGIGPGLGRSESIYEWVIESYQHRPEPTVMDADGLFALSLSSWSQTPSAGPRILTPHAGEFERLSGVSSKDRASQIAAAIELAKSSRATIVLKGAQTLITDGTQSTLNNTGNPGMATGGSGDCLTGIITSLLGQGLSSFDAAHLGVYWHGLAADLWIAARGGPSVLATDIIESMPKAFQRMSQETNRI